MSMIYLGLSASVVLVGALYIYGKRARRKKDGVNAADAISILSDGMTMSFEPRVQAKRGAPDNPSASAANGHQGWFGSFASDSDGIDLSTVSGD